MRKSLRLFICQNPTERSIDVWIIAHHKTFPFVSSLIWRNVSSRSCLQQSKQKQITHNDCRVEWKTWMKVGLHGSCSDFWPVNNLYGKILLSDTYYCLCLLTLWKSCCLLMYHIWSMRCCRLYSVVFIISFAWAALGFRVCSPIWKSKCTFCT